MRSTDSFTYYFLRFQPDLNTGPAPELTSNESIIARFLVTSARYFELPVKVVAMQYQKYRHLNLLGSELS